MESHKLFMNIRRLRHLKRCNNFPTIKPTDVAQHSYFTTMLAMLLVDELNENKHSWEIEVRPVITINKEILLRKCLLHDFEEAFTSDIPYPVKHASSGVQVHLERAINGAMINLIGRNNVMGVWDKYRISCKDGVEGSVVAFCDMLELAIYCYEELCMGNKSFEILLDNCNKYLDTLLNKVLMDLYEKDLSYFKDAGVISELLPSIWKLRQVVQRNLQTGEYILQDFTVDIS